MYKFFYSIMCLVASAVLGGCTKIEKVDVYSGEKRFEYVLGFGDGFGVRFQNTTKNIVELERNDGKRILIDPLDRKTDLIKPERGYGRYLYFITIIDPVTKEKIDTHEPITFDVDPYNNRSGSGAAIQIHDRGWNRQYYGRTGYY